MHTYIAYSLCIILTPCFAVIIDSSGSSCVWGRKGGRLVRTDPINPLCLEATPIVQTEEMEQQQPEGNWTLEDVKRALIDNIKAMMQNKLRQALVELMPPLAPATTIPPTVVAPIANPPIVDALSINNNNAGGQPLNAATNALAVEMRFKDMENYMVKKARKSRLSWFKTWNPCR